MTKNKYEILSPAGSFDALVAGINCGCNAIYLGGEKFSARSKAINFSNEELIKAVNYAHLRNVRIFVAINILIDDEEMQDALEFTEFLYKIGVDAIIVQDIGFATIARGLFPKMEIHASTQMAINNLYGAKFVEGLGFERVVLARETDLDEINKIKSETKLDVEAFIHGALCVAFSGECIMSSMIGGRSGNRGECAQPCRKSYEIYDLNKEKLSDNGYFLSTKDLNTLDSVDDLISRGVDSLKIEGRMKKPEYVAQIVSSYKKAIEDKLTPEDYLNTEQIFNRGFTNGIPNKDFGRDFISYDRPDNRGTLAGEVVSFRNGMYDIKILQDIEVGDGLEFATASRTFGMKSDFKANAGDMEIFRTNKKIELNSKVYKTSSIELTDSLKEKINKEEKFQDISMSAEFLLGQKPKLKVVFGDLVIDLEGGSLIEEAKSAPVNRDKIISNLTKFGGTVYSVSNIDLVMDDNIFLPISLINLLRRDATEKLDEYLLTLDREEVSVGKEVLNVKNNDISSISVEVFNISDLKEVNKDKVSNIYMDIRNIDKEIIDYIKENGLLLSVVLPKFQNSKKLEESAKRIESFIDNIDALVFNNLAQVEMFKNTNVNKIADIGLNVFNSYTAQKFLDMGFEKVILSPELNATQIKNIVEKIGDRVEVIAHGLIPVMTMPHCPMAIVKNCKDSSACSSCRFSKGFFIRDPKEVDFLVQRRDGVSEVFNSFPIMWIDRIEELNMAGVNKFKLNLRESIEETIDVYKNALLDEYYDEMQIREELIGIYNNITYGHYNRGIING